MWAPISFLPIHSAYGGLPSRLLPYASANKCRKERMGWRCNHLHAIDHWYPSVTCQLGLVVPSSIDVAALPLLIKVRRRCGGRVGTVATVRQGDQMVNMANNVSVARLAPTW